jgi:hypothetical protein
VEQEAKEQPVEQATEQPKEQATEQPEKHTNEQPEGQQAEEDLHHPRIHRHPIMEEQAAEECPEEEGVLKIWNTPNL